MAVLCLALGSPAWAGTTWFKQRDDYSCGAAVVQTILSDRGKFVSHRDIAKEHGKDGASMHEVKRSLERRGAHYTAMWLNEGALYALTEPAVFYMPPYKPHGKAYALGHFVVIEKHGAFIRITDPGARSSGQGRYTMRVGDFARRYMVNGAFALLVHNRDANLAYDRARRWHWAYRDPHGADQTRHLR